MGKEELKKKWIREYEKEYARQTNPYREWIAKWEGDVPGRDMDGSCVAVRSWGEVFSTRETFLDFLQGLNKEAEYVILTGEEGRLAKQARHWVYEYFETHPVAEAVYGDEDEWDDGRQERQNPWFKPDWSPDTLRSCQYLGNVTAFRASLLQRTAEGYGGYPDFWRFLIYLSDELGIAFGHIDRILYHTYVTDRTQEIAHVRYPVAEGAGRVSVIIPSRDHPELLRQCLSALRETTAYPSYEVIVVDNGSAPEAENAVRSMQGQMRFDYLYQEMPFNFSKMCNLGAAHARGDVLIFLNDDIEVQGTEWMAILTEQALQPRTGAVGAKLYYPDSRTIQHAGIANMKIGPAHKLGGMEDRGSLYHGRNLADFNVLAVTAACMAVERKKYEAAGGFCEELAVAYNDVDFCFSLYEKGYYNLVRNDVTLFHHESYSRGSDRDAVKEKRLLQERKKLYQRHPRLYGYDPFYSRHLVQERPDADYHVEMQYEHEQSSRFSQSRAIECPGETKTGLFRRLARRGPWCRYHLDEARIRQSDLFDEDSSMLELEGWCALTDRDMAEYERALVLIGEDGAANRLEILDKLRPDAAGTLPEQPHGALCGFVVRLGAWELPDGEYRAAYLFYPRAGGRPLVQYGERLVLESAPERRDRTVTIIRERESGEGHNRG